MRRDERQHLKENELAHTLESLQEFVGPRAKPLLIALAVVVVGAVLFLGVTALRQRSQSQGQELLAEALVALDARVVPANAGGGAEPGDAPAAAQFGATGTFSTEAAKLNAALPKLKAAADAYPDAPAGITARYHMAGALAALGRHAEAIGAFEDVAKRAGANTLYGRMATLGKADAQARGGQLDAAITTW